MNFLVKYATRNFLSQALCNKHGCLKCAQNNQHKSRIYEVKLGKRTIKVRGFEGEALNYILKYFKPNQIKATKDKETPVIRYKSFRKERRYFPDFYLPHRKEIIEVKSVLTLGLPYYEHNLRGCIKTIKSKKLACIEQGYKFTLLLVSQSGDVIKLPTSWETKSRKEISLWLKKNYAKEFRYDLKSLFPH